MNYYEPVPGLRLPAAAMGCMRIAEMEYGALERQVLLAAELGMNFFDHADFYGEFRSEARFGEVLARNPGLREKIYVQSKCGIRIGGIYDSSAEHITKSVENSLRSLHTGYLDFLLIHRPDPLARPDEIARAFERLHAAGKVRYFGVSNHNPAQIEALQQAVPHKLLINQMQMSILHTPMIDHGVNVNTKFAGAEDRDGSVLEYCKAKQIMLQAWSPFQYGFFEGVFVDNPKFPELNGVLEQLAQKYETSKTALAVAWLVRIPAMVQVICGTTSAKRLEEIARGADLALERDDWYAIYRAAGNQLP